MKMKFALLTSALVITTAVNALEPVLSSAKPFVELKFTQREIRQHANEADFITDAAARCLRRELKKHHDFYDRWGISPFFGDQSRYGKMSWNDRKAHLSQLSSRLGQSFPEDMVERIKPVSCIGLALMCLEYGFESVGSNDIWEKVKGYSALYAHSGLALQHALQQLGWTSIYWNPDTTRNEEFDAIDRKKKPNNELKYWGEHHYTYEVNVRRNGRYYFNKVDNDQYLVNFYDSPPESFKRIPFFLGVANLGYHVFPGFTGTVIEGHSSRRLTDRQTVETSPFNPLARGGGPRGSYFSGLMVVPPGYVSKDTISESQRGAHLRDLFTDKVDSSFFRGGGFSSSDLLIFN